VRVGGAVSDLHAADARYHYECKTRFMAPKSVQLAATASSSAVRVPVLTDVAYDRTVTDVKADQSQVRNSSDIYRLYQSYGGTAMTKRTLLTAVTDYFNDDLLVFTSSGIASILVFREKAKDLFNMIPDDDDDNLDDAMKKIAKHVKSDSQMVPHKRYEYQCRINMDVAEEYTSQTMMDLLTKLLPDATSRLPMIMICNMITSQIRRIPTPLQVTIGTLIKEKELIHELYKCGVVCSYDEVLRFRKSAAIASLTSRGLVDTSQPGAGMAQVIVDNFDANISSQNGLQSTHALAMLLTQTCAKGHETKQQDTIRRIRKEEMTTEVESDVSIQRYDGPKKPAMPPPKAKKTVLPLRVLSAQVLAANRAYIRDFDFLSQVIREKGCPEWNGFNSFVNRNEGHTVRPATTCVYTPLIDMKPSDPDTMLTSMVEADKLMKSVGQNFVVFTCDQQLYKVAVNITWAYPERFGNFILRLGGMHFIMNFIGCVGTLMADTGLSDVLESAFGGVANMLTGKRYPQNFRALRMVVEELLRTMVDEIDNPNDLVVLLESRANDSRTTQLWVDMLIKPVLLMMLFSRAEKEADWPLHLLAVELMIPYFFAAHHPNYAHYGLYYLRSITAISPEVLKMFLNGDHVTRHTPGIWNGIWSDMMIETTFMRYGKGPGGIIGNTLKPSTVKTWALSLHICSMLAKDFSDMITGEKSNPNLHKEEMKSRMTSDANDRAKIGQKLQESVDPLDPSAHPEATGSIVQIVSGRIATDATVNVHDALAIGQKMMKDYETTWPDGFHTTLPKIVNTMAVTKKHIQVGTTKLHDTTLIYSRIIGLQASGRDMKLDEVLKYELAPMPTSMFTNTGEMRLATSKSTLKNKLKVEVMTRSTSKPANVIIDGSAILWVVHWPAQGTVQSFIDNFVAYLTSKLKECNVYLIFDRYNDYSIKGVTRTARGKQASRRHQLSRSMMLPPQKVVLTVTYNKVQLINLIIETLRERRRQFIPTNHKLVVTGPDPVPVEINEGSTVPRDDMRNTQEEADVIIIHHLLIIVDSHPGSAVNVISDDTDVFALLVHFYHKRELSCPLTLEATSKDRKSIDIKATTQLHTNIAGTLLSAHAVSGCDTVAQLWGIGKTKVVKLLQAGHQLTELGNDTAALADVVQESTTFIASCYGYANATNMTDARIKMWKLKTGKASIVSAPKLMSLPPTNEAFQLNVLRAHLQACIWKHAADADPPNMDPIVHGWLPDRVNKTLQPVMLPDETAAAPDSILKLIKCGCENCKSSRCSCSSALLPCTIFCNCEGGTDCCNERTKAAVVDLLDDDDDDDES